VKESAFETADFTVWTAAAKHSVPSLAVRVESRESGAAVVYSSDTAPCAAVERLAAGARLLIHEATFGGAESAAAQNFAHSTAAEAAAVARAAQAAALWLVHYSPSSLDGLRAHLAEASAHFDGPIAVPDDLAAFDF
jgi:ribonuclease Z